MYMYKYLTLIIETIKGVHNDNCDTTYDVISGAFRLAFAASFF